MEDDLANVQEAQTFMQGSKASSSTDVAAPAKLMASISQAPWPVMKYHMPPPPKAWAYINQPPAPVIVRKPPPPPPPPPAVAPNYQEWTYDWPPPEPSSDPVPPAIPPPMTPPFNHLPPVHPPPETPPPDLPHHPPDRGPPPWKYYFCRTCRRFQPLMLAMST